MTLAPELMPPYLICIVSCSSLPLSLSSYLSPFPNFYEHNRKSVTLYPFIYFSVFERAVNSKKYTRDAPPYGQTTVTSPTVIPFSFAMTSPTIVPRVIRSASCSSLFGITTAKPIPILNVLYSSSSVMFPFS